MMRTKYAQCGALRRAQIQQIVRAIPAGGISKLKLAEQLWPDAIYPRMWRVASQGGPYAWVRCMGRLLKTYKLRDEAHQFGRCWRKP